MYQPPLRTVDTVMAESRAASFKTRSIKADAKLAGLRLALSMLDLTTLEGKDSAEKVRGLCSKARNPAEHHAHLQTLPSVAAVCVYPSLIGIAKESLAGSNVKVAAVATGFPSGQFPLAVRLADVRAAVEAGADEIDMVISRGLFLAGKYDDVRREILETAAACRRSSAPGDFAHLKVILETGELETLDNVRRASDLAIAALIESGVPSEVEGGAFIKTSTGKVSPAATMPVTLVMLEAIRDCHLATGLKIGMKPAGGIRTAKDALHYLVMLHETLGPSWLTPSLFRFGASALANDLLRQLARHTPTSDTNVRKPVYAARYDFAEV